MHLAPADLQSVHQDGLSIRFGILGPVAYVLAEVPAAGSSATALERPCVRPHWGFVLAGDVTLHQAGRSTTIPVGHAFHVPAGGDEHRLEASGGSLLSGFELVDPGLDTSEGALRASGLELIPNEVPRTRTVPTTAAGPVAPGRVDAYNQPMSQLVLTRARLGATSGYTSDWCDLEHWGMVTAGRIAMEWEGDIEVLGTGDIFYCPPGPPGHRINAADPATILDLTPFARIGERTRMSDWRRPMLELARPPGAAGPVAVAALL
jgi:quercetin dioxygenase-like cupin family protein